jgi:hypothetical protein
MKPGKAREIVIEFEKLQLVRKRAMTEVRFCERCQAEADFIALPTAANLFEIEAERLFPFVHSDGGAGDTGNADPLICLNALVKVLTSSNGDPRVKLLGEKK